LYPDAENAQSVPARDGPPSPIAGYRECTLASQEQRTVHGTCAIIRPMLLEPHLAQKIGRARRLLFRRQMFDTVRMDAIVERISRNNSSFFLPYVSPNKHHDHLASATPQRVRQRAQY